MTCWFIGILLVLTKLYSSDAQRVPFKVITADPWVSNILVIRIPSTGPRGSCNFLSESALVGDAFLTCDDETNRTTTLVKINSQNIPTGSSRVRCMAAVAQKLKGILGVTDDPTYTEEVAADDIKHQALFQKAAVSFIPEECMERGNRQLKVTKLEVMVTKIPSNLQNILPQVAPLLGMFTQLTAKTNMFQAEFHLMLPKSEKAFIVYEFYEEANTDEFQRLWNFVSTMLRNVKKYELKLLVVPKIKQTREICEVTDRDIPVIVMNVKLSYVKPANEILLKLRNEDAATYASQLDLVKPDVHMLLRSTGYASAVWSYSVDLLELDGQDLIAWVFVKLELSKMPEAFTRENLHSNLKDYLNAKFPRSSGTYNSAEVTRAMLTKTKYGCGSRLPVGA